LLRNKLILQAETKALLKCEKDSDLLLDPTLLIWVLSYESSLQNYILNLENPIKIFKPFTKRFRALLFASMLGDAYIKKEEHFNKIRYRFK